MAAARAAGGRAPSRRRRPETRRRAAASGPESRAGRRAARSARVRRRRRILVGIGGGLLVLVLAFVLWYELESHALGPPGPAGGGHGARGRVDGRRRRRAEPAARDRQLAGLPDLGRLPRHADRPPRELRAAPEPGLLGGAGRPGRRPQHLPGRRPARLHALRGGPAGGQPARSRRRAASRRPRPAAPCTRCSRRPDPNNLEGMLGTGDVPRPPRRERHHDPHGHGAALRPGRRRRRASARRRPRAGPDAVPGDHRGLDRGEGGLHPGQHARRRPGHLQPPGPGHAAADGLDRPVRARPGRGTGDGPGPPDPVALQHLPQQRA